MSFLREVLASRKRDIEEAKRHAPREDRRPALEDRRDFAAALRGGSPAIVAEIKRASPSAGFIAHASPAELTRAYEAAGASAISVVTEPRWFGGRLDDLGAARAACPLPILRKDFITDEYQIEESALAGADAVLLIVAALDQSSLKGLRALAESLGLCALVEVHDEAEAARALDAGASLVGVNNRDLHSLAVDLTTALRVRRVLPAGIVTVAESGYQNGDQLRACYEAGFDAVLVGEALLRAQDPKTLLRSLRGVPA